MADASAIADALVLRLMDAWNLHDMHAFAAEFSETADVVNRRGALWHGRETTEIRMDRLHKAIFKGRGNRHHDLHARELRPGVIVAQVALTSFNQDGSSEPPAETSILGLTLVESGGTWYIEAFQNTEVVQT